MTQIITDQTPIFNSVMEFSEDYLARKFSRPVKPRTEIVYQLTKDAGYLHQYYLLRDDMFAMQAAQQDAFDAESETMIARVGNHCIGGARLTFSDQGPLPMEKGNFALQNVFPQLPLSDVRYVEISRMAILPEFHNSLVTIELSRQLLERAVEGKARYAFTLAPVPLSRNYREAASLSGLKWNICYDVPVPASDEDQGKLVLSVLDLAPAYRPKARRLQMDIRTDITLVAG